MGPMLILDVFSALLGVNTYGTHVNGYTLDKNKGMQIWLARRALNKPTYPGRLDNMVIIFSLSLTIPMLRLLASKAQGHKYF